MLGKIDAFILRKWQHFGNKKSKSPNDLYNRNQTPAEKVLKLNKYI